MTEDDTEVTFDDVHASDEDWDAFARIEPLWLDRFGDDSFYDGGVYAWRSAPSLRPEQVLHAYLKRCAPYVRSSDFEQVLNRAHQSTLLRTLYVYDQPAGQAGLVKVAPGVSGKAFAREVMALLGSDGALFANVSPTDPFEDAPRYDRSSANLYASSRCACAVFVTARFVGRFEVLFDDKVEA